MFETGSRARAYHGFAVTCRRTPAGVRPHDSQEADPIMQGQDSPSRAPRRRSTQRPNPTSTERRLKRNVRVDGRRTTIVLEAYVLDSIDSMPDRKRVSLDTFCADVDDTRLHSSMASSARLVVLAYFRLLKQINSPPFVDPELQRLGSEGALRALAAAKPPAPLLQLALRRFAQDEASVE